MSESEIATESAEPRGGQVAVPLSPPTAALELIVNGNGRFRAAVASSPDPEAAVAALRVADPYAIVLGCSDSRVPPELVFDEAPGRLFVVRVASNVAGSTEIGSVEYALARWQCPLLIVLGHTECGGIAAALDKLPPGADVPPNAIGAVHLGSLLFSIKTNLGRLETCVSGDPWRDAVCANVRRTVELLLNWSEPIRRRVDSGQLCLIGAVYDVATGAVEFMDHPV